MITDPVYTFTEASNVMGVSRSTIRRRHKDGAFPNAYKDVEGNWQVPLTDLRQAGLRPPSSDTVHARAQRSATVTLTKGQDPAHSPTPPVSVPSDLERERDEWRTKAHAAELRLAESEGYLRGIEGTLEESRLRNRELASANQDLTQALLQIEAKVTLSREPIVVEGETVPSSQNPSGPAEEPVPRPDPVRQKPWWKRR